jgi:hypothetical protein
MMKDYPAAHSMDTEWFAVDADGNVGIFDSSEDGAVPTAVRGEFDINSFIERLPKGDGGILVVPIDGSLVTKNATLKPVQKEIRWGGTIHGILLVLKSAETIHQFYPHVLFQLSGSETVIYVEECEARRLKSLVESGEILKGIADFSLFANAHLFGVFSFGHQMCGIPAPYQKGGEPPVPLKMSDLPSTLQTKVSQVRFESLRFTEVQEVQPIEHMDCSIWGDDDYWLDTKRERAEWQEVNDEYEQIEEEQE